MDIDEIILKELETELTHKEWLKLNAWLKENPRNNKTYNQIKLILAKKGKDKSSTGEEAVLNQLKERISSFESHTKNKPLKANPGSYHHQLVHGLNMLQSFS